MEHQEITTDIVRPRPWISSCASYMWDILQRHFWPQARLRQLEADEDVIPERPGGFRLPTNIAMDKRWPFIIDYFPGKGALEPWNFMTFQKQLGME